MHPLRHGTRAKIMRPIRTRFRRAARLRAAALTGLALFSLGATPALDRERPSTVPFRLPSALIREPDNQAAEHCRLSLIGANGSVADALASRAREPGAYEISPFPAARGEQRSVALKILYWSRGASGERLLTQANAVVDLDTCRVDLS